MLIKLVLYFNMDKQVNKTSSANISLMRWIRKATLFLTFYQLNCSIIIIMKMYIVQKYTEKMKNKNTHEIIELGLLGTHELYHKINVFTVKTI